MFLQELRKHRDLFCGEDFRRIEEKVEIYAGLWQESHKQPELTRNYKGLVMATGWSAVDVGQAIILGAKDSVTSVIKAFVDPTYLSDRVLTEQERLFTRAPSHQKNGRKQPL